MKPWNRFSVALRTLLLVLFCAGTLTVGCQSPSQNGATSEDQSKVELTGNAMGSHVVIDNLLTFDVTNQVSTQFRLQPGRHHIHIEKQGTTVLDQMVSLSQGQILVVSVP